MNLTAAIVKIVEQAPSLAALCFIVWIFLKNGASRDVMIREMHNEHIDAREQSRIALKENSDVMRINTEAIRVLATKFETKTKETHEPKN